MIELENERGFDEATASRRIDHGRELHIITCEYPPQLGGVADFTQTVVTRLASAGTVVHVWCPGSTGVSTEASGVVVHRELGTFSASDLRNTDSQLDRWPAEKTLFLQWVPHGYGYRSMNVGFCLWLRRRSRQRGDQLELMVHEPFLPFQGASWRVKVASLVQRFMMAILLRSASRVWVSTESWFPRLRFFLPARVIPQWLPVPSNISVDADVAAVTSVRRRYSSEGTVLVGHFGTFGGAISRSVLPTLAGLLQSRPSVRVLLLGRGSAEARVLLVRKHPDLGERLMASGAATAIALSHCIQACDLMIQPFPDGVSARRTSVMAALSHGLATLTTVGELTEPLWARCGAAALVNADDPDALLAQSQELVDNPAYRERLAASARRVYDELFAVERTIAIFRADCRVTRAGHP